MLSNKWIGAEGEICADARGASRLSATRLGEVRPGGAHVAVALPADAVFFERLSFPNVSREAAGRLVAGQLDLRLPIPIEKCLVLALPVRDAPEPTFLAFAVPRDKYTGHVASFRAATGCDPEAVFPEAAALAEAAVRALGGGTPSALLLHVAPRHWTVLAVENGVLLGVSAVAAGDTDAVLRDAHILSSRFDAPPRRLLVSGAGGAANVAEKLNAIPGTRLWRAEAVADPDTFLAAALARAGAAHGGGFRSGKQLHPAAFRRRLRACALAGLLPLLLALGAYGAAFARYTASARRLAAWNARLDADAARIARTALPQHGRAAAERAKGLFDWRNPVIAAAAAESPLAVLPALFETAAARRIVFHDLVYADGALTLSGHGAEADVAFLRLAAEGAGFTFAAETAPRADGVRFDATVTARKGDAP